MAVDRVLSPIWTRTPIDIICSIIEETDDIPTLDSWCLATAKSHLCKIAYARRYYRVRLDLDHLHWDPRPEGNIGKRTRGGKRLQDKISKSLRPGQNLIERNKDSGLIPATFLRHLELDFQPRMATGHVLLDQQRQRRLGRDRLSSAADFSIRNHRARACAFAPCYPSFAKYYASGSSVHPLG